MRRIWEPCSFVGQKGVCTVCFPTFYIFMYPHIQIAVSVDAEPPEHLPLRGDTRADSALHALGAARRRDVLTARKLRRLGRLGRRLP
jgi:hypothetical protein